ncbi:hypothetical protein AMTR_s00026p00202320 [Amborella trichopoda]|uniref:Uncharacterized protein n=1 Tax=Amborella trichopoda TaxID=13333 RepID=W1PT18_AMBTC|nr:hypothetical protein AMTR_s00026p00202320 [Amborella trichopoda]
MVARTLALAAFGIRFGWAITFVALTLVMRDLTLVELTMSFWRIRWCGGIVEGMDLSSLPFGLGFGDGKQPM